MAEPVSFIEIMRWTDDQCREYLERMRWPDGPVCPKCGGTEPWTITRKAGPKNDNKVRQLYKCRHCKRQYTATVGTIFEDSKVPLSKWFAAIYLMCASKKGISAHQLHRQLDVTYRTAWFMCHRVREAMKDKNPRLLAGVIEADETYVGGKPRGHHAHGAKDRVAPDGRQMRSYRKTKDDKSIVFGILERGGDVRTMHVEDSKAATLRPLLKSNIDLTNAHLMTDEYWAYNRINRFLPHDVIRHKSEYVRGEIHTQGIESYWSIVKRGAYGTYHHLDAGYLSCYLNEFEFRFNRRNVSDELRFSMLMAQTRGRLEWYCRTPPLENPFA